MPKNTARESGVGRERGGREEEEAGRERWRQREGTERRERGRVKRGREVEAEGVGREEIHKGRARVEIGREGG